MSSRRDTLSGTTTVSPASVADERHRRRKRLSALRWNDPIHGIEETLESARRLLDVEIAFVGELRGGEELLRWVAGDTDAFDLKPGEQVALEGCIVVPVTLPDGRFFGRLHCASRSTHREPQNEDRKALQVLAQVVAQQIERIQLESAELTRRWVTIHRVLEGLRSMKTVFQPIVDLSNGGVVGAEALARFSVRPLRRPDVWIAEARSVGLGTTVELTAFRNAIARLGELPESVFLSVNVSCETLMDPELEAILADVRPGRIVLEILEAPFPDDTQCLREAIERLHTHGFRVAIDDAGSGFGDLRRIRELDPDIIKLDMSLTHHVDRDPVRYAWLGAMTSFVSRTSATLIAEGIESPGELARVRTLGIPFGQGNLLAPPSHLPLPLVADIES